MTDETFADCLYFQAFLSYYAKMVDYDSFSGDT